MAGYGCRWMSRAGLASVLALVASTPFGISSAQAQRWSPSRDEAVVAESGPVGSGLRRAGVTIERGEASPLRVPRPARLMPRSQPIGRMHTYAGAPVPEEVSPGIVSGQPGIVAGEILPEGTIFEPGYYDEGAVYPNGGFVGEAGDCCDNACCGDTCCGNWNSCGPVPLCCLLPRPNLDNFELFAGVQGFTGPANRGGSGSFGFHEGFNYAMPICCSSICGQVGLAWTQSNFDGSALTDDARNQIFLTGGAFRRVDCGLQGGLVLDYLHDEWDYSFDVLALRGEVGWKCHPCSDVGFWFSTGLSDDTATARFATLDTEDEVLRFTSASVNFEVNDLFAFYCRQQFACGGEGRLYGGFTGNSQGLFGGDARVPLNPCWSLAANFLYVAPGDEQENLPKFAAESWNVSLSLVWKPFARPGCTSHCRPLFDVANNGTLATTFRE
jgi:hypothetical protein